MTTTVEPLMYELQVGESANHLMALTCRLANEKHWTVWQLAKHAHMPVDLVQRLFDANAKLNTDDVDKFARAFHIEFLDYISMAEREVLPGTVSI